MKNQRSWLFWLITVVDFPALLLGIVEATLRLIDSGHSTEFTIESVVDGAVFAPISPSLHFIRFSIFMRSSRIGQNLAPLSRNLAYP